MKKIAVLLVALLVGYHVVSAQDAMWNYPVKPGMIQWQQLTSVDAMYEICQIPENLLNSLSTESLVQICLSYPAPLTLFLYNSPQDGFNNFYTNFNGIRELLDRQNVGYGLLSRYSQMSYADFDTLWNIELQGAFSFHYQFTEIILSQDRVIQSLSQEERKLLLEETIKKYDMKYAHSDLFGGNNLILTAWIMAKVLYVENSLITNFSSQTDIVKSLESGQMIGYDILSIYQQAQAYVNGNN